MTRSIQGMAAIALLALFAGSTPAAHAEGDKVTPVRSEKLPNVPGKSVTTVLVNYAPGGKSVSHHHAGSVMAYVLTGQIRSENSATGPAKVYKAGESFFEPSGSEHLVSENASATEPASLLAVFVGGEAHKIGGRVILPEIGPHAVEAAVIHQVGFLEACLAAHDIGRCH